MWQWISSNSGAISAVASFCTLFIWLFYAQLLYLNFKRQRQPKIIVNRGAGSGLSARCVISNMSSEAIFIEHLAALVFTDRGRLMSDLTDLEPSQDSEGSEKWQNLDEVTRQGPMQPGHYSHAGSFAEIVDRIYASHGVASQGGVARDGRRLQALEIRIIAVYGSEDKPVGASRSFAVVQRENGVVLQAPTIETQRYASRFKRLRVRKWIRELRA